MMNLRKFRRKARDFLGIERRYFGSEELDRKLKKWINFDNGIFVEAGANNGILCSNTYHFERFCNWTGLLVEPIPEKAEQCRRSRPGSIVENCALGAPDQNGSKITLTYCDLMTVAHGGMMDGSEMERHIALGSEIQKLQPYNFTVPCTTLSALLDKHRMPDVDLLSLDVEGYELPVLHGLDLTRHRPKFILVEARDEGPIRSYLAPHYVPLAKLGYYDILFGGRDIDT